MRSIPTIFCWDKETRMVSSKPLHLVEWVFLGKGTATRKYDGVAIRVERGKVFRHYEWREGEQAPPGFIRCEDPNPKRPHASLPGWVPVPDTFLTHPKGTDEKALKEAWEWLLADLKKIAFNNKKETKVVNQYAPAPAEFVPEIPDGTYELCGPKIHGNHEGFKTHVLLRHGTDVVSSVPRTYEKLRKFLETFDGEGIVWHYKFGNTVLMAKIKRRDFGFLTRVSKEDLAMAYRTEPIDIKIPDGPIPLVVLPPATVVATGDTTNDTHKTVCASEEPVVATSKDVQESGFASVFEADSPESGDDIHLEVP